MILLDTNVVSELMRPDPDTAVAEWIGSQRAERVGTTAITVAEVRDGIQRLPDGARRRALTSAADLVFGTLSRRILPFDLASAAQYAVIVADRRQAGAPIEVFDAQIAAICRSRDAVLATRNAEDFITTGIEVIDPWTA